MRIKGWMKIGKNGVSFFRSEKDAEMSSLLNEGYALADNVQEFELEVDNVGEVIQGGVIE